MEGEQIRAAEMSYYLLFYVSCKSLVLEQRSSTVWSRPQLGSQRHCSGVAKLFFLLFLEIHIHMNPTYYFSNMHSITFHLYKIDDGEGEQSGGAL